jgi:hypothetical protein
MELARWQQRFERWLEENHSTTIPHMIFRIFDGSG